MIEIQKNTLDCESKSLYLFLLFLQVRVIYMSLVEIKSAKITEKGQITIPKYIRDIKGFEEGAIIAILAFEDHIEIRPMESVSEKISTAIASEKSLAKHWNSKEDEKAWKNL